MSHELRNFEEGFKEGKIAGLKMANKQLIESRPTDNSMWSQINIKFLEYGEWLEQQIEELGSDMEKM